MINFKYAFQGLSKRISFTLLAVLQLSVSFLLLYASIYFNNNLQQNNNKVLKLINNKIIYTLKNNEDYYEDLFKFDGEEKYLKYKKFLENSRYFTCVSYEKDYVLLKDFNRSEKFLDNSNFVINTNNKKYVPTKCLIIDDKYTKYFSLKIAKGKIFNTNNFNMDSQNKIIPVVLGNNYTSIFKLGDIIDYMDKVNNVVHKVKVIGFLEPNQYFTDASIPLDNIVNLDNYIVFPQDQIVKLHSDNQNTMIRYNSNYRMNLYNSIINSVIIINGKSNEQNAIKEIENKSKEFGFFDIKALSTQKQLEKYVNMYKEQNYIINTLFCIVFGVCSIGIISNMLYYVSKRYNEFAVHTLSGASIYDILARFFYEVIFLMGTSFLLCCIGIKILSKLKFVNFKVYAFLELFIIAAILTIIIALIPVLYVSRIKTNELLRRMD